jgi:hypothetical protein
VCGSFSAISFTGNEDIQVSGGKLFHRWTLDDFVASSPCAGATEALDPRGLTARCVEVVSRAGSALPTPYVTTS